MDKIQTFCVFNILGGSLPALRGEHISEKTYIKTQVSSNMVITLEFTVFCARTIFRRAQKIIRTLLLFQLGPWANEAQIIVPFRVAHEAQSIFPWVPMGPWGPWG